MTQYVATINTPGYLPTDDEPAVFDTAQEAWEYLADERERAEDETEGEDYSDTRETLAVLAEPSHWRSSDLDTPGADVRAWLASHGLAADGTGTVYGETPGYAGDHDLGVAYSVSPVEED